MNGFDSNTSGANVAMIGFAPKGDNDVLSDVVVAETARRLIVTIENTEQGDIVRSATAPEDKTKVWIQIDPVTGVPIGQYKTWDEASKSWKSAATVAPYVPPKTRTGSIESPIGQSTVNFEFEDIGTNNYQVSLAPTTFRDGSWAAPPASFPTTFGWVISYKAATVVTVAFFGVPAGGITWEIDLTERKE